MKIEWLALHDSDEFIVLDERRKETKQQGTPSTTATTKTSIKEFLAPLVMDRDWNKQYGAVQLNSISFGRNPNVEVMNVPPEHRLLMDWTWRSNMSFTEYPQERYKLIVRPTNVHYINIHYIQSGKKPERMAANVLRVNHYKKADEYVFQTKATKKAAGLLQDSWFREKFRNNVTMALMGERTYIPIGYHDVTPGNSTSVL
jgi:Glycosyltransferase family 92